MKSKLNIRRESSDDSEVISHIINAAFLGRPYASGDEATLVVELRRAGDLSVSLVAELDEVTVGHIAFSPARSSDGSGCWSALGPLAVLPAYQRNGIGSALIYKGVEIIENLGANGCILTGDLRYYSRFGFEHAPKNTPMGEPAAYFMIKLLRGHAPVCPIHFHDAFKTKAEPIRPANAATRNG